MLFYIGTHMPNHAKHFDRCFISINVLRRRKSDLELNDWILDSGAFTEITKYGQYRAPVDGYAEEINRWARCGNLEMAVCQDYMCEPWVLEKTQLPISRHQELTIERYDALIPLTTVPVLPVLQGYKDEDYVRHIEMWGDRFRPGMRVGVGSICRRNSNPQVIADILEGIKRARPDLRLHGFGLKITALANAYICDLLYSADSMAWSYHARKHGRNASALSEALAFIADIEARSGRVPHQMSMPIGIK